MSPFHALTLPRRPQAVVFDMDGVLFDTESLYRDALRAAAVAVGREMPATLYYKTIGLGRDATQAVLQEDYGGGFDFDAFWEDALANFYRLTRTQLRLKPGVVELLDFLDEAELPRAIATSSRHSDAQHHLGTHGLRQRFHSVIADGDYARSKPQPDPFLKAAERLGVAPKACLALEDSYNGVRAAVAAGMMTIMVPDLLEPTDEMRRLCVHVVSDLHDVVGMLTTDSIR